MFEVLRGAIAKLDRKLAGVQAVVIVWGPGQDRSLQAFAKKREQIRQKISEKFPSVEVHYPEEIGSETRIFGTSALEREMAEALLCNLVICLDAGIATSTELAAVSQYPRVATKVIVCTPEEYATTSDTMITAVRKKVRNQHFFTDAEFGDCSLVEKYILPEVRAELVKILAAQ